jgi:hypothetical protein
MSASSPRAWEPEFIRLWERGATQAAIAEALGIPVGTVKSRAHTLQQQGKIQSRPRGGAYPTLRARQQGDVARGVSEKTPGVSYRALGVLEGVSAEVLPPSPPAPSSPEMTPLLQEILQELRTLTQGLATRVSDQTPQVSRSTPGVREGVSLGPREKTERWNLHLPKDLIAKTKTKAKELGIPPSELVAEVLRRWLAEEPAP